MVGARVVVPSFWKIEVTFFSTAPVPTNMAEAIAALVRPSAIRVSTSRSLGVSGESTRNNEEAAPPRSRDCPAEGAAIRPPDLCEWGKPPVSPACCK